DQSGTFEIARAEEFTGPERTFGLLAQGIRHRADDRVIGAQSRDALGCKVAIADHRAAGDVVSGNHHVDLIAGVLREGAEGDGAKREHKRKAIAHGQLIFEVICSIWSAAVMTLEFIS